MSEAITIDISSREVVVPESEKLFGVAGEGGIAVKKIKINGRIIDGTDLNNDFSWRIACRNANGDLSTDIPEDVNFLEDGVSINWRVGHGALAYKGTTYFMVCAVKTDVEGHITQEWHSDVGSGKVNDGLPCTADSIGKDDLIAELQQLIVRTEHLAASMPTSLREVAAELDKSSESWAHGGTGTREGEDTDNAKYYAKLAQQVSQGAVGWYADDNALNTAHPTGEDGNWAIVGTTDTIWVWDSDTSKWKDSYNTVKFSDYYTKSQMDTMLENQKAKYLTVSIPVSTWIDGSYRVFWDDGTYTDFAYRNKVSVSDMTAETKISISQRTRPTNSVRTIVAIEPGAGCIYAYADTAPSDEAVFVLEVLA